MQAAQQQGYHLNHFISAVAQRTQLDLSATPHFPEDCGNCIISGPPASGKTNLLFHYAWQAAKHGRPVIFICRNDRIEQSPPLLPPGCNLDDPALANVHFRYLTTLAEVQKYAACLHMMDPLPGALLVDALSSFAPRSAGEKRLNDAELIRTIAQLAEAAAFIRRASSAGSAPTRCPLVITEEGNEAGPQSLYLFQRWFQLVLVATGDVLFTLPLCAEWHPLGVLARTKVKYSIGQSYMSAAGVEVG